MNRVHRPHQGRGGSPGARAEALAARAVVLLGQGRLSASDLARKLGVSEVTAKRVVGRLRRSGHRIASVRLHRRAHYEVHDEMDWEQVERDPFLSTLVRSPRKVRPRVKREDADYDRD